MLITLLVCGYWLQAILHALGHVGIFARSVTGSEKDAPGDER
jgi:hypothetical protein